MRNAFNFVSLGHPRENQAYLDRETGAIYWQSDHADLCLGKPLALQFTAEYLPAQLDHVRAIFSHPDAVARFKELLVDQGMLSAWQTYEQN